MNNSFYCPVHGAQNTRLHCPRCEIAWPTLHDRERPHQQPTITPRDTIQILEARIADLEASQLQMSRRISQLEHRINDGQASHNAVARSVINLEVRADMDQLARSGHDKRITALEELLRLTLKLLFTHHHGSTP